MGRGLIEFGARVRGVRQAVRTAVDEANSELRTGATQIQNQSRVWSAGFAAIRAAAITGGIGVVAGLGTAVGAAIGFENAFAGVRKTVDASEQDFARLRTQFREMSR